VSAPALPLVTSRGVPRAPCERLRLFADDGVRLNAERWTRAPDADPAVALLVLPGFWRRAASSGTRGICQRLVVLGEVTALDFRGHGGSRGRYTFGREEGRDLAALLDHVRRRGAERIGIVALSMGGWIAADLLASDPQRYPEVRCVAFVGTPEDPNLVRARWGIDLLPMITFGDLWRVPRLRPRSLRDPRPRTSENLARIPLPAAFLHHRDDWLVGFRDAEAQARSEGGPRTLLPFTEGGRYHADSLVHFLPEPFFAALLAFLGPHLAAGTGLEVVP
jgi:pimeloyl-ACP methyl ester carboxylesterase